MTQFNLISFKLGVDLNLNICDLAKLSVANFLKKRLCIYIYLYIYISIYIYIYTLQFSIFLKLHIFKSIIDSSLNFLLVKLVYHTNISTKFHCSTYLVSVFFKDVKMAIFAFLSLFYITAAGKF